MIDFSADVDARGPVFDARGPRYMDNAARDGSREVAEYGQRWVRAFLARKYKGPITGRYSASISVVQVAGGYAVDGTGTIYANWLEGTGSMNYPTTRFKGYRAFQRMRQSVRVQAARLAWPAVRPWIRRLGGGL